MFSLSDLRPLLGRFCFLGGNNMQSPFALARNYKVTSFRFRRRLLNQVTEREKYVLDVIKSCGAAAALHLQDIWPSSRGRKKLKTLSSIGVIARHFLEGDRMRLNVYNQSDTFDLKKGLKQLAVAQLYTQLKKHVDCQVRPGNPFPTLTIFEKPFQVIALRDQDEILPLVPHLKRPSIVVCETLRPIGEYPARLTTDVDLIKKPLSECFYLPDGTPDTESAFARLGQVQTAQ